jgi:hypothetical protein
VAAGHDQPQRCRAGVRRRLGVEQARVQVGHDMIHADQRQAQRPRQGLGRAGPDQQRPDEPGAVADRHRVEIAVLQACPAERLTHDGNDPLEVGAAGDLRHHARVAPV